MKDIDPAARSSVKIGLALAAVGGLVTPALVWRPEIAPMAPALAALLLSLAAAGAYLIRAIVQPLRRRAAVLEREREEAEARRRDADRETDERHRAALEVVQREAEVRLKAETRILAPLAEALKSVAAGDLTVRMAGEAPALAARFDAAVGLFGKAMLAFAASLGAIRAKRGEIGAAIDELTRRGDERADLLEEAARALEARKQGHTATAAELARAQTALAAVAREVTAGAASARLGGEALAASVQAGNSIAGLTSLIDEIAFQTSLLALNAGVEAARVGDAGKGFAVVAHELRGLAERSTKAGKELGALTSRVVADASRQGAAIGQTGAGLTAAGARLAEIGAGLGNTVDQVERDRAEFATVQAEIARIARTIGDDGRANDEALRACQSLESVAAKLNALIEHFRFERPEPTFNVEPASEAPPLRRLPSPERASALRTIRRPRAPAA